MPGGINQGDLANQVEEFYPILGDRVALTLEFERYMHKTYGDYHAMFLAFTRSTHVPYVVLCNIKITTDKVIIPLSEFREWIDDGFSGLPAT